MGACGPRPRYGRGRMSQARRDSNPQPPVLETGALPVELRTSVPLRSRRPGPQAGPGDGQGRSRTADTAIFSRVLYQLSYLAKKIRPGPGPRAEGSSALRDALPPTASRPASRARPRIRHRPPTGLERIRRQDAAQGSGLKRARHADRRPRRTGARPSGDRTPTALRGEAPPEATLLGNSGGRIRTCDLRVMSPTSYQTAPPRNRTGKLVQIPE